MGQSILLPAKTHPLIRSVYWLQGLRSGVGDMERRTEVLGAGKRAMRAGIHEWRHAEKREHSEDS